MKLFAVLGLTTIALLPLPAIAQSYSRLNLPICHMITSQGRVINLNRLCGIVDRAPVSQAASISDTITLDDICSELARRRYEATNQFLYDRAQKDMDINRCSQRFETKK
jgi:hypothetical protein